MGGESSDGYCGSRSIKAWAHYVAYDGVGCERFACMVFWMWHLVSIVDTERGREFDRSIFTVYIA